VRRSGAPLAAIALIASACAPPPLKLPTGAGTPVAVSEARAALEQATAECRSVKTLTAEIAVSGSAAGQRLRARLLAGVAAPASARLEATAPFGAPFFIFVSTGDDATLLLPRDSRVLVHGRPDAVLDAIAGIPLTTADLARALTGCAVPEAPLRAAVQFGDTWQRLSDEGGAEVYISRQTASAPWRLSTVSTPGWRIDYPERRDGVPAAIRLASVDPDRKTGKRFDLRMTLSQVETNTTLGAAVFEVDVPKSAVPITLDELRHARPGVRED